jgi:hypothetical protein
MTKRPQGAVTYKVFYRDADPDHGNSHEHIADALQGLGIWAKADDNRGNAVGDLTVGPEHIAAARAVATSMRLRLWARHDPGPKGEEGDTHGWRPCPKCGGCPSGFCECDCNGTRKVKATLHVKLRDIVDRRRNLKVKRAKLPRRKEVA